jgi:hypothetical protein
MSEANSLKYAAGHDGYYHFLLALSSIHIQRK